VGRLLYRITFSIKCGRLTQIKDGLRGRASKSAHLPGDAGACFFEKGNIMRKVAGLLLGCLIMLGGMQAPTPSFAADCTGHVVGVRPPSAYNPRTGAGFLAVRTGPGSNYAKIGELYAGDEVSVYDRRGSWYAVTCMRGSACAPSGASRCHAAGRMAAI
jgi:hypothetical protein